ncbi:MAG: hypothetical protein Kow00121_20080 [Elainellaceae cyanobacterium]
MAMSVTDPEQWYAAYEAASAKQQYDMLLETMSHPLTPEFIEDIDLGMLLAMMRDELVNHNLVDQAATLIRALRQRQPELHQQEFPFLNSTLVQYDLYRNDFEQVKADLEPFTLHPAEDVDQTFVILDYLKLFDATDLAIDLCCKSYDPIRTSPNAVLGAEMKLSSVLLNHWTQQAYQDLKAGNPVDWEAFLEQAVQYGFRKKPKWVAEIQQNLTAKVVSDPGFFATFKRSYQETLQSLSIAFCREMLEQKQISFICGAAIWDAVCDFLESREISRKKLAQPEVLFSFTQEELDRYAAQRIDSLLSMQQAVGVALLWGIPYVYDFLRSRQIISETIHQDAIAFSTNVKAIFIEGEPQLWKYDFVHRWLPPDSISQTEFDEESQQFAASLEPVTPLGDEPGQGVTHQSFIDSIKQQLPPDLVTALEQMEEADGFEDEDLDDGGELDTADWVEPSVSPFQPIEPAKPRKSALRLAAELPEKGKKLPKKKR